MVCPHRVGREVFDWPTPNVNRAVQSMLLIARDDSFRAENLGREKRTHSFQLDSEWLHASRFVRSFAAQIHIRGSCKIAEGSRFARGQRTFSREGTQPLRELWRAIVMRQFDLRVRARWRGRRRVISRTDHKFWKWQEPTSSRPWPGRS